MEQRPLPFPPPHGVVDWGTYRLRGIVRARQLTVAADLDRIDGRQHGEPGDWLVESHGDLHFVPQALFDALYEALTDE